MPKPIIHPMSGFIMCLTAIGDTRRDALEIVHAAIEQRGSVTSPELQQHAALWLQMFQLTDHLYSKTGRTN